MSTPIPIDASFARNNFFDILDKVYSEKKSFLVKKSGIPVATIISPSNPAKRNILEFAGIWKDLDAEKLKKYIRQGRRDGSRRRKSLVRI